MYNKNKVSIVTPSFEKHAVQYGTMIETLKKYCLDFDNLSLITVVEKKNVKIFSSILDAAEVRDYKIVLTEDVLAHFGIKESPAKFLRRVGKFTFQTVKKMGGLLAVQSEWSLVLDSEGLFRKDFRMMDLVNDYAKLKYVFYTETKPRGWLWERSTGFQVNKNVGETLQVDASKRWYMEYFHWFYETEKARDLIESNLGPLFLDYIKTPNDRTWNSHSSLPDLDFFENVLYYNYIEKYYSDEYDIVDFKSAIDELLPAEVSGRFILDELPFSLFGNDYLLNIVSPSDIHLLAPLFEKYKLAFVRLEPPFISPSFLTELDKLPYFVATISSHHNVWLRKKVAICISGEFRHVVHRTPEQQVRQIKSFLSGVDVDIYIHGWRNTSEPLIIDELNPKRYLFEEKKSFRDLERKIRFREPRLKPNRDHGSLSMFYSIQESFDLIGDDIGDYDYVVRIRPDTFFDKSLKEILYSISDGGDFLPGAVYVPRSFHSKGINDQFAIGRISVMQHYFRTFEYIKRNISHLFFNPESILLKNLLENKIEIALVDLPYALMRHLPMRIHDISRVMHDQEHTWWSRTDHLPVLEDVSKFFADKICSMESTMRGEVGPISYIPCVLSKGFGRIDGFLEIRFEDNNPSGYYCALFNVGGEVNVSHCKVVDGAVDLIGFKDKFVFCFVRDDKFFASFWIYDEGKLINSVLKCDLKDVLRDAPFSSDEIGMAWGRYDSKIQGGLVDHRELVASTLHSRKIASGVVPDNRSFDSPPSVNQASSVSDRPIPTPIYINAGGNGRLKYNQRIIVSILSPFLTVPQKNKLLRNPGLFFYDSRSSLAKLLGRMY
ncbi:hypothetical protein [Frateuria aurantia]|uniref:Uncharacterized protein n=1 Tax=Frateuria aurantia (strain ATCC 33424 / DSM 6220 / KCTC 2777 / LMG 1558 / NBRC 3245 / NCIMB 13370) TaxID=767434 RepID=H8L0C6_FRAAD|nr:hypothetical protein [Frateuria aurantia]AFC87154.1 hypothetical protein Fraau_2820 [Frateuria aurantia DSM 6220]